MIEDKHANGNEDGTVTVPLPANLFCRQARSFSDFLPELIRLLRWPNSPLMATLWERAAGCLLGAGGLLLISLTAVLDYQTGPDLSLAIFYLLPIAAGAWWGGFAHGILLAVASVVAWHLVEIAQHPGLNPGVSLWNGVVRFCFFVMTSSLLTRQHLAMRREQMMARTDPLTGAANGRTFYEVAQLELQRSGRTRRPFTMAYLDVDNFKKVNDRLGHAAGDALLCRLAETIRRHTRGHDLLARLGGDEFALLLPDTDGTGARASLTKLQETLQRDMGGAGFQVTYSIGAATFLQPPADVDAMVRRVDALMYAVKRAGKDRVHHEEVPDPHQPLGGPPPIERRAEIRALCSRPVRVVCGGSDDRLTDFAKVRDLSSKGIGLELSSQVVPGTILTIEPVSGARGRTLLARVIRSERADGGWVHGCELAHQLNAEELREWLG
jgi:diguanylate cyclase (GGDEF)-like protein